MHDSLIISKCNMYYRPHSTVFVDNNLYFQQHDYIIVSMPRTVRSVLSSYRVCCGATACFRFMQLPFLSK